MAAQMNYSFDTPKGVAGGKVDLAYDEVVTRQNEEADGVLKFGMAAAVGTSAGSTVKVPAAGTTKAQIEGVVLHAANTEQDMSGKVILKKDVSVGIMRKGHVWGRLAGGAVTSYSGIAYVVLDGKDAGCFTSNSAAYSVYEKCESTDSGAKQVVADSTESPTASQVKLSDVAPVASGYAPAVGDYVVSKQLHGATLDIGAKFGNASDTDNGIAVIELG